MERYTGAEDKWLPGKAGNLEGARPGGQGVRGTKDRVKNP